jgi:putative spermidine/putrescine transport system ATP-binding protein
MTSTETAPDVRLENVVKRFDAAVAVDGISVEIPRGSFFAMLGPSGCGKTTTLRMIGGFDEPTEGRIFLGDQDVVGLPPYKRDVNTVFQSYALFPHMSIEDNVAFGLERKGVPKDQLKGRVAEMLELVGLTGFEKRKPRQLSGGQQQRVALGRALVNHPRVLLLDEPLGALDLKLREDMQIELKQIQQQVGITFIYVTHDQGEALTMSDRMAVFNNGRIEQLGAPAEVYERPTTRFVAGFVGTSNLITGEAARQVLGKDGAFTIRPEKINLAAPDTAVGSDEHSAGGRVRAVSYLGPDTRYWVALDAGSELIVTQQNIATTSTEALAQEGKAVRLIWKRQHELSVADGSQVEEDDQG